MFFIKKYFYILIYDRMTHGNLFRNANHWCYQFPGHTCNQYNRMDVIKQPSHEQILDHYEQRCIACIKMSTHLQQKLKMFRTIRDQTIGKCCWVQIPPKSLIYKTCTSDTGMWRLWNYECKKSHNAICPSHAAWLCGPCYTSVVKWQMSSCRAMIHIHYKKKSITTIQGHWKIMPRLKKS